MNSLLQAAAKHRDYSFLGLTQSLCPECRAVVPTKIIARGRRVYFRKTCPTHGTREDFICSDVQRYDRLDGTLPGKLPAQTSVEPQKGCPYDCGLCSEHEQHTCIAVIEITDGCNLSCPMCYAGSGPGQKHKALIDVQAAIDRIVQTERRPEVVQLSGGEPTLHPEFGEILDYALQQPIDYVMVNTNGLRIAHDRQLLEHISTHRSRVEVYFQLDALDDLAVQQLRGQTGLLDTKLAALQRLGDYDINVTLVATLQAGVNESAPAELLEFARGQRHVTGLSFQPATYSGRHLLPADLEKRITFPDVIDCIANDPRNEWQADDFFPLPCAHPNCHWIGLAFRAEDQLEPLTRWLSASDNRDLLANGISFTREKTKSLALQALSRLACGESGCCGGAERADGLPVLGKGSPVGDFLNRVAAESIGARDLLRITITSFLDVYNFDLRRVMKCCTHHVLPSGHVIPFCAYNVLYRDGHVPLPPMADR